MQKIANDRYKQIVVSRNFINAHGGLLSLSAFLRHCNHFDHDLHGLASVYRLSMSQCSRLRQTMFRAYYIPREGVIDMILDEIEKHKYSIEEADAFILNAKERELALKQFAETLSVFKLAPNSKPDYYP